MLNATCAALAEPANARQKPLASISHDPHHPLRGPTPYFSFSHRNFWARCLTIVLTIAKQTLILNRPNSFIHVMSNRISVKNNVVIEVVSTTTHRPILLPQKWCGSLHPQGQPHQGERHCHRARPTDQKSHSFLGLKSLLLPLRNNQTLGSQPFTNDLGNSSFKWANDL